MEFHENSYQAKKTILKIPFEMLPVGKSYRINCNAVNERSLRALVSNYNVKSENLIICKKHKDVNCFEIANVGKGSSLTNYVAYDIVDSSPQAAAIPNIKGKTVYPFANLEEGKSFTVPIVDANEKSLKVLCSVQSRKYDKKFVLIKHEQSGIYEVACLRKTKVTFYENSPAALAKGAE